MLLIFMHQGIVYQNGDTNRPMISIVGFTASVLVDGVLLEATKPTIGV